MKSPRVLLLTIVGLTCLAVLVDWPNVPIRFSAGPIKVNTVLAGPKIDWNVFGFEFKRDLDVKLGLDLKGGTSLTLKADVSDIAQSDRDKALEAAKEVIDRRINLFGVTEPIIQTSKVGGDYRIIVELPGVTNLENARQLVGQTAKLEFREFINPADATSTIPTIKNTKPTGISGKDLKTAAVDYQQGDTENKGGPVVRFELKSESANKFSAVTRSLIGKPLIVFLDDIPVSAPIVKTEIGKEGVITGLTSEEAKRLSIQLSAGALPVKKIDIISERTLGPTLGKTSIDRSLVAGIIGFTVIALFMAIYYGFVGILGDIALVLFSFFVFLFF